MIKDPFIILIHLNKSSLLFVSAIILITGSVPDFLTKILPVFFNNLIDFFIAFLHFGEFIIFLSFTLTFSNTWGIGTKLVTAYDNPSLGAVYKLTALKNSEGNWDKKIKLSEQKIKINNPGINQILRFKKKELFGGDMIYDSIAETIGNKMIDPNDSTRYKKFNKKYSHEKLLIKIFEKGKLIYICPSLKMIKQRLEDDLKMLDNSHKRLENPHSYPVGIEENLYKEKKKMILNLRK